VKIVYSFGKTGFEAQYWTREIAAASSGELQFVPFNHSGYVDPQSVARAQLLDNLYYEDHAGLQQLYRDIQNRLLSEQADVLLVDTYCAYHPDFLRKLEVYKVLRIADGPLAAYDRDFAYLHAFDHILYHSPAYSRDMDMDEKLRYCGARRIDFWPLGSFDALCDPGKTITELLSAPRDIDVVFVGALHPNKMPLLSQVKRALGRRLRLYGAGSLKKKLYFNVRYAVPTWVRTLPFEAYVPLYQRAKIGINVHNRGDYTVGSYRLFDLPANGVMQISDGGRHLERFFAVGKEIEAYCDADELIDKLKYYLSHAEERSRIAAAGHARVRRDYRIGSLLRQAAERIRQGLLEARGSAQYELPKPRA
jgi:spore maturation protein CgeB